MVAPNLGAGATTTESPDYIIFDRNARLGGTVTGTGYRDVSPADALAARYVRGQAGVSSNQNQYSKDYENFNNYLKFGGNSQYDYTYRVFPDDLGTDQYNHYMTININVQTNAKGEARTSQQLPSQFGPANYTMTGELSTVDQLKFGNNLDALGTSRSAQEAISNYLGNGSMSDLLGSLVTSGFSTDAISAVQQLMNGNLARGTRRIKESIALFMPTPMVYTHQNVYEEISLTSFGARAAALATHAAGVLYSGAQGRAGQTGGLGGAFGPYGQMISQGFSIAGRPINPKLEVLFSHTPQRSFVMEFLMAPKNEKESLAVKSIVDTLRYHSAPEIDSIGGIVPLFIPPSEFDIKFYHKGKENTKIPRINTCALERVEVDYAPSGIYSTFSNGYPVAVRLSLAFRELEILHKQRVQQGF